jgi:hypothetical protein
VSAFDRLASKLAAQGVRNPRGLAYTIGARKYGKKTMAQAAANKVSVQTVLRRRAGGKG